jgi:hypothetical protein
MSFSIARLSYRTPVLIVLLRCTALVGFSKLGVKMDVEEWLNGTDTPDKNGHFNSLDVTGFGGCKSFLI